MDFIVKYIFLLLLLLIDQSEIKDLLIFKQTEVSISTLVYIPCVSITG